MQRFTTRLAIAAAAFAALFGAMTIASQKSAAVMARAANQFIASLSAEQRAKVLFAFDSEERLRWHFIPNEMFPRKGLTLAEMSEAQRRLAHDLLRTGFSARGYVKVSSIIELEEVLKALEGNGRFARDKEQYLFSVFGTPATKDAWGWRVEGHHLSVRFTVVNGGMNNAIASTPMFLGTNPAEVHEGARKGLRILAEEEDAARALVQALPPEQQKLAIVNASAPSDILTTNKNDIEPLPLDGIAYQALSAEHRALLMKIIEAYANTMEPDLAAARLGAIRRAGMDDIRFAWAGDTARGKKHYYRLQGPTFLIEFDNTQNDGNHVHSVWRDFKGDFGRDLLREHLRANH